MQGHSTSNKFGSGLPENMSVEEFLEVSKMKPSKEELENHNSMMEDELVNKYGYNKQELEKTKVVCGCMYREVLRAIYNEAKLLN